MEEILNGKYRVTTDSYGKVLITGKDKGIIESRSVEALLLLEIIQLLKRQAND